MIKRTRAIITFHDSYRLPSLASHAKDSTVLVGDQRATDLLSPDAIHSMLFWLVELNIYIAVALLSTQ
jgi:hypothetical protein